MKKIVYSIIIFALFISGCSQPAAESEPTPTPAPEFGVQEYFTPEEMEYELQFVEYRDGLLSFQMFLPDDWHYGILECIPAVGERGIDFWPPGSGGEVLSLRYYPEPFGVCGTGLTETEGELPGTGKLRVGYYDGRGYPSFISFYDSPGAWVLLNNIGEGWNAHWTEIEKILGSLVLDGGLIRMSAAEEIALEWSDTEYDYIRKSFDIHNGEITVEFCAIGGETEDEIVISCMGGVLEYGDTDYRE